MITIEKIQASQIEAVKAMLRHVWHEFFGADPDEFVRNYFDNPAALADVDEVQANYFDRWV